MLMTPADIDPIPLTRDWFLYFGIPEKYDNHFEIPLGYILILPDGEMTFYLHGDEEDVETYIKVNYVHELQNLYHTLAGQDLVPVKPGPPPGMR